MKKTFTILIAAIAAIMMMAQPMKAVGQTKTTTTIASWGKVSIAANTAIKASGGDATNNGTAQFSSTKAMTTAGSSSSHCYYGSSAGGAVITFSNLDLSGYTDITMTFYSRASQSGSMQIAWSSNGTSYTNLNAPSLSGTEGQKTSNEIPNTATYIRLTHSKQSGSLYFGTIEIKGTVSSGGGGGSGTDSDLAITNASTALSFDMSVNSNAQVINYTTSSTGEITISPESPTNYYSYVHDAVNKTITVTPLRVTPSTPAQTVTIHQDADNTYNEGSVSFTVSVAHSGAFNNIADLKDQITGGDYSVALSNAVVTYVNGNYAYIQDASGAIVLYKNGHGLTAGNTLSGTASVTYQLRNSNPQITAFSGITPGSGSAPSPTIVTAQAWNYTFNNVLSTYFKIKNATITQSDGKYYVSLNGENVQLYMDKNVGTISTLDLTKTYYIVGFPTLYTTTKELQIFEDPTEEADPIITPAQTSISLGAYAQNGTINVTYTNFDDIVSDIEFYDDDQCSNVVPASTYSSWFTASIDASNNVTYIIEDNTGAQRPVYFKVWAYNSELEPVYSNLITITQLTPAATNYPITISYPNPQPGTITVKNSSDTEITSATPATEVYLSFEADDCYTFTSWSVTNTSTSSSVTVTDGHFTMPAGCVTISVICSSKTVHEYLYVVNGVSGEDQETCADQITLPTTVADIPVGFNFAGWTVDESDVEHRLTGNYTFENSDPVIFYAVFSHVEDEDCYYQKITSTDNWADGKYLIVSSGTNNSIPFCVAFNGALTTLDPTGDINKINVTITSDNTIESSAAINLAVFTIESITGGYSIKSTSRYYIGQTANSNGLLSSKTNVYTNTITAITSGAEAGCFDIIGSGSAYLRYNAASNTEKFRYYKSSSYANQKPIQLFKKIVVTPGTEVCYTRVFQNETLTAATTINGPSIIPSGKTLNAGSYLTNTNANNLIVEDGGQLKTSSTNVQATLKKSITAWDATKNEGWYTISSPIDGVSTGTLTEDCSYNLYQYNEPSAHWWGNGGEHAFTTLAKGVGYLYRRNSDETVSFSGTVNVGSYNTTLTCTSTLADNIKGFHLIGNPFAENISSTNIALTNDDEFTGGYVLTKAGSWEGTLQTTIKPCEGFLIQVAAERTITISKVAKGTSYNRDYIKFIVANSQYEDVTFALFEKAHGLSKIDHRNSNVPMLYISQNNQNYAIAPMSDNTKSFNLSFKAMTTGMYTLRYDSEGEYNYLHIIDRLTGADVDMLLEGEYSFIGTPNDNENRFIVNLEYMPNYSEGNNEIFAFQSGNEILVSGSGELQIFDVTGRSVMTTTINGAESINLSAKGVYIFRLVGSEIKTQKIVVR